jgi:hypothetical protein
MATNNRIIETEQARDMLVKFIQGRPMPFTATVTDGKHRTTHQNRLQRQWMVEIAAQLGDRTPEEVRGYCKLHFGIPILRENDAFRKDYDNLVRPLPYEAKLKLMMEPFDFGVTRIMSTRQKTEYLDAVHRHFSEQGLVLTNPEDLKLGRAAA